MWTRISKCQSGGKETSVNRPSNIYSIIARRQVAFLKRRENDPFFFLLIRGRVGREWCIFWVLFLLTAVSQVSAAHPKRQMEVLSQQFMSAAKCVKNCEEGGKKTKQVMRKRNSWLMLPLGSPNSDRLLCLYSYGTETSNVNQTR